MLPRSLIFFDNSAARLAASLATCSLAIFSSAALDCAVPLERVNLSGVVAAGFLSSTLACSAPLTLRSAAATGTAGAFAASLPRKSLKSRLCAITVVDASAGVMARAWSSPGIVRTAPAFKRFRFSLANASGLARSSATSI